MDSTTRAELQPNSRPIAADSHPQPLLRNPKGRDSRPIGADSHPQPSLRNPKGRDSHPIGADSHPQR